MKRIIFTALFLFVSSQAWAQTYFWASSAGSASATCTDIDSVDEETDPGVYGTPHRAVQCAGLAGASNRVLLKAGSYSGSGAHMDFSLLLSSDAWPGNGVSGNPTIIKSIGGTVTLQPTGQNCVKSRGTVKFINFLGPIICDGSSVGVNGRGLFLTWNSSTKTGITDVVFEDWEIRDWTSDGIFTCATCHRITFRRIKVHDNGDEANPQEHGGYLEGDDLLIEDSEFYNNWVHGFQIFNSDSDSDGRADRAIVRRTKIYNNGVSGNGSCVSHEGLDGLYEYVIFSGCASAGIGMGYGGTARNTKLHHVLVTGNGVNGVVFGNSSGDADNAELINSIVVGNGGTQVVINANTSGVVQTTNKTTGSLTDCTVSSSDFRHKQGSSCIDAGTPIATKLYNGSAPDQGPYEAPKFASCAVAAATPNKVSVTFENNVAPPILITDVTALTIQVDAGDRTESAPTVVGSNVIDLTIDGAAITGAQAVTFAAGSTNTITDSANLGNDGLRQGLQTLTAQNCENNTGGAPSYAFDITNYQIYDLRTNGGSLVKLPSASVAVNQQAYVIPGAPFIVASQVDCTTADCPGVGVVLGYIKNGGSWTAVSDTPGADAVHFYGTGDTSADIPAQGTSVAECLAGALTDVAGSTLRTANAIPTFDLAQDGCVTLHHIVKADSGVVETDVFEFELRNQDGSVLNAAPTVKPKVTIIGNQGSAT